jgi:hypothetical protein
MLGIYKNALDWLEKGLNTGNRVTIPTNMPLLENLLLRHLERGDIELARLSTGF